MVENDELSTELTLEKAFNLVELKLNILIKHGEAKGEGLIENHPELMDPPNYCAMCRYVSNRNLNLPCSHCPLIEPCTEYMSRSRDLKRILEKVKLIKKNMENGDMIKNMNSEKSESENFCPSCGKGSLQRMEYCGAAHCDCGWIEGDEGGK